MSVGKCGGMSKAECIPVVEAYVLEQAVKHMSCDISTFTEHDGVKVTCRRIADIIEGRGSAQPNREDLPDMGDKGRPDSSRVDK